MLTREWFSAAELAELALPALPGTKRGIQDFAEQKEWRRPEWQGTRWRARQGRGGGIEYHYSLLPSAAQARLALMFAPPAQTPARDAAKAALTAAEMWEWFERLPAARQQKARDRLAALDAVEAMQRGGVGKVVAAMQIAAARKVTLASLYNWEKLVHGIPREDWLPYLAPRHAGSTSTADCTPEAWEALKGDYLRPEKPNFSDCYRRLQAMAAAQGWTIPSERTLQRRMDALPAPVRILAREGEEALKRLYPAQERDRGVFHALEAVNADGHKWDVFVRWPDGTEGRAQMIAFQDIYSGKILSWRVDRSENADAFRLAFGDLVEEWGIPDHVFLDNTRAAANKWMTGGVGTRFRFKVKPEDPAGIFNLLGVQVHWTRPYSGQSKPIERAFRDFAQGLAKHPAFAGAYAGNSTSNKPSNYGEKSVPLETFLEVLAAGIAEHNARLGRQGGVCRGRSFDQVFAESYAQAPIRKATAAQRRLWLLAAEAVTVRQDGSVHLLGNRYWAEFLPGLIGHKVTLRFDPEALHEPLHVYRLDGAYCGAAECVEAAGFADTEAARRHGQARKRWLRAQKEMLDAERTMDIRDVAALLAKATPEAPPAPAEARLVRPVFGNTALKPKAQPELEEELPPELQRQVAALRLLPFPNREAGGD